MLGGSEETQNTQPNTVQHSLWYLRSIAWASFGDIALLNLIINTGSLEISAACFSAFPEFIVLTEKQAYLLSNWQKKHSIFDKRSVTDLVNGFDAINQYIFRNLNA